ncbi:MAG: TolC family protein [Nitrospirae bacterium]|nr:TolC family protein [Candidatus Manganitrophaceae bacterium]
MLRLIFYSILLTIFTPTQAPAEQGTQHKTKNVLQLQDAISEALVSNPGLARMGSQAKALAQKPSQAETLPDPHLSLNARNLPTDSFNLEQEPMTQIQIGIMQSFPFPGKLALKKETAQFQAQAAEKSVSETRLFLIRQVKTRWWSIFKNDRALEIIQQNKALLTQFVEIAQTKYKVGKGLQQDVLLAQLELSKLLDLEITLYAKRRKAEAALNGLLNRATNQSIRLPDIVSETLPPMPNEKRLLQDYKKDRPLLAAVKDRIFAARSRLSLAKKGFEPDFKLGAVYGYRDGQNPGRGDRSDFVSLLFSMNLPVYGKTKQSKAIDQRLDELTTARWSLSEQQKQIEAEISSALASYRQLSDQVSLFKTGIIPQAKQTVASMLSGYQVNKVDFLNLVRAQLTLYNFEIQYWKTLSEANMTLAQLAHVVGKEQINAK